MKFRHLRHIRIWIAIIFFMLTAFLFLDFRGSGVRAVAGEVLFLQFVPSLVKFLDNAAAGAAGFIAVLVLTILFGRIYCSTVCPLGTLQDIISRFAPGGTLSPKKMPGNHVAPGGTLSPKKRPKNHGFSWSSLYRLSFCRFSSYRFFFLKPNNFLRYSILFVTALLFLTGSGLMLNLLDPFSSLGRILTNLVRPLVIAVNNLLVPGAEILGTHFLYLVRWPALFPISMAVSILTLILVGLLSARQGRLYCNTVCPVGTFLGLVSKLSIFRIRIDPRACMGCGLCEAVCKAGCIDPGKKSIDVSRCVGCFNCLAVCPAGQALEIENIWMAEKNGPGRGAGNKGVGRRGFIFGLAAGGAVMAAGGTLKTGEAVTAAGGAVKSGEAITAAGGAVKSGEAVTAAGGTLKTGEAITAAGGAIKSGEAITAGGFLKDVTVPQTRPTIIPETKTSPVSPPGSVSTARFSSTCTACQLCVSVCPSRVLVPGFLDYGISGIMQPRMDFRYGHCNYDCTDCLEICPSGAILPLSREEKQRVQVGVAKFILENCVVHTDNTNCGACSEHCPTKAVDMVPYLDMPDRKLMIPKMNPDICVGCGGCEYACPTKPFKAIYVDGNPVHRAVEKPVEKPVEKIIDVSEDFPF
ncbi:MAG: 4Fe-4S dicluster domain-containing protein [Desulfamplus sp.]|nr:4Fe-4S dicluster domain-containing protein [Desulfamplus sp.]